MRFLSLVVVLCIFHASQLWGGPPKGQHHLWAGWGVSQSESFWAARSPAVPKWHLNWETYTPWTLAPGDVWESPLRAIVGLSAYSGWGNGTQDFGQQQSAMNGELGVALGPSTEGSLFRLGCEMVVLSQMGMTLTEMHALDHNQTEVHWTALLGVGPGWYVGWGDLALRQQTLLGYGINGYHHEVRLALGYTF